MLGHAHIWQNHTHFPVNELANDHGALFWLPFLEKCYLWLYNHEFFNRPHRISVLGYDFLILECKLLCPPLRFYTRQLPQLPLW